MVQMQKSNAIQWVGHRGYPECYPENTLLSLIAALEHGAAGVEFDIQISRDGVPVVVHDADLMRTASVPARVADLTAAELAQISVHEPQRFGGRFLGAPLSSLEQVVTGIQEYRKAIVFAEIKTEVFVNIEREAFLKLVVEQLQRLENTVIISFDLEVLRLCQAKYDVPVGWVLTHYDDATLQEISTAPFDYLICNYRKLPPSPVPLWKGAWDWFIYDVIDASVLNQYHARGVTFFETWNIGAMRDLAPKPNTETL